MDGFFRDNALLEQKFVKTKRLVFELLGGSTVSRFVQVEIRLVKDQTRRWEGTWEAEVS